MKRRRIFGVINQKGGSTKTTTSVNLAAAFVERGYVVRLTDLDPQEGSSTVWLPPMMNVGAGLFDVFEDRLSIDEATSTTSIQNLFLVPSYTSLRQVEKDRAAGSELVLRTALQQSSAPVDIEIIDCPHSMDTLAIAGLAAAAEIIIPVQASALDIVGMGELLGLAARVKKRLNPEMRIASIVVGRTKGLTKFDTSLLANFREEYPDSVVLPISDSVRMREATNANKPINLFEPGGKASNDFKALAEQLDNAEVPA